MNTNQKRSPTIPIELSGPCAKCGVHEQRRIFYQRQMLCGACMWKIASLEERTKRG